MRSVMLGALAFGQGLPKICIPLMGKDLHALRCELAVAKELPADLFEWRVDACLSAETEEDTLRILSALRNETDKPILATFRTYREGGIRFFTDEAYVSLLEAIIKSGDADLVDIELFSTKSADLILLAKEHQVLTVVSYHDFQQTPAEDEIYSCLKKMHDLGADLPKIAVMPRCREDVLTLLKATSRADRAFGPVITMSMGALGTISRISGEIFGSCLTFGTAEQASALGQLEADVLFNCLQVLHDSAEG